MFGRRSIQKILPGRLAKFLAVITIAGGAGVAIGAGLSELSGGDSAIAPVGSSASTAPIHAADARITPRGSAAVPAQPRTPASVRVLDSVLHPAGTADGQRRQRARLTVRIQAENRGNADLTPARPSLLVGRTSTETDAGADGPGTRLGTIKPGATASVTLRFEVAGAVTEQLAAERRAVIRVAGRSHPISIKLGNPVDAPPTAARTPDE